MVVENNLYIIYSAKDEDASGKTGWIFSFHRFLEMLLSKLLKNRIKINLIEVKDFDTDKIYNLNSILIPIASQALLNTANFKEEIKKFHEKAIHKERNSITWNSRIFKVFRNPLNENSLLDFLSDAFGYNFYHKDPLTNDIINYSDFTGPQSQQTFWMRLYDLAYDVSKVINQMESEESEIEVISKEINTQSIYLAAVGSDLENERSVIKRELQRNGFSVLPENNIPDDIDLAIKMIRKDMSECSMAIHLIGADPGKIKGTNASVLELQLRIASEYIINAEKVDTASSVLAGGRIIWITPYLEKISVKQKIFIENLKKDADAIRKAELLETNIEELKGFISNKLEKQRLHDEHVSYTQQKKNKVVYLICDKEEYNKCQPVEKFLNKSGYDVVSTDFQGTPDAVRTQHNQNLKRCDATLIYYGGDNEKWMKSKLQDLLKSLGLEREKPISPQAIFIDTEEKFDELFSFKDDTLVLQNKGKFKPKSLEPFLAQLEHQL